MDESKITMSRSRGCIPWVRLCSNPYHFFNTEDFFKLMGLDEYHPCESNSKVFRMVLIPRLSLVTEFARWLDTQTSGRSVAGLCMDLANKGFLFYDRSYNGVTLKNKGLLLPSANARKEDYDVICITSSTKAPLDNAVLDLKNYRMTVNGVSSVFLSDSQRVAIYPYNRQLVIGKNRSLEFDGVVEAGLFTVFGHQFTFSYDTFKIRLQTIDSIRIAVETRKKG